MKTNFPKDDSSTHWTSHVKRKMMFYGLSGSRIMGVVRNPKRIEDGIAPQTVAVMQRNDKPNKKEEIWVMYAKRLNIKNKILNSGDWESNIKNQISKIEDPKLNVFGKPQMIVISAWRYPGITKVSDKPAVPEDVMEELEKFSQMK